MRYGSKLLVGANERQLAGVHRRVLLGAVAEPPPENSTPNQAEDTEDPKRVPPVHRRGAVGGHGGEQKRVDDNRSRATHESPGHPDGPLGETALHDRKPIMKGTGNVRESASLPH